MAKRNHPSSIVTGGAGFIGSHVVDALIARGHTVHIIDNLSTGFKQNINPRAVFHKADIRNLKKITPLFKGVDYVFHLAALARIQPSIIDPIPSHDTNITGTLNVLLSARDAGVKRVIYSASSSAYGDTRTMPLHEGMVCDPKNPYAIQKYMGELYARAFWTLYGLPTVSLRYFNVYGPRQTNDGAYATVIGIFFRQKLANEPFTMVADGRIKRRDYTHVADIVEGNMRAMESKKVGKGEVINLGAGKNYSVWDVVKMVGGSHINIPKRKGEALLTLADYTKAKKLLGWSPKVVLQKGIEDLREYYGDVI